MKSGRCDWLSRNLTSEQSWSKQIIHCLDNLRVAKFNQKSGLSPIVYPYYNWKRYQTVPDSPENLMDKKHHCLGLSEELLGEIHCLGLNEDLIGEVRIESRKLLVLFR